MPGSCPCGLWTKKMQDDQGFLKLRSDFASTAIHASQSPDKWRSGAVVTPIVTSTTFKQSAPAEHTGYLYGRLGNPTRNTLEECIAELEGGKFGLTFGSGLGAVTTILGLLKTGDHIISIDDVYGGTNQILREIQPLRGIETTFIDMTVPGSLEKGIQENTRLIWLESPTNPTLKVPDLAAVAQVAKCHGNILTAIDNSFLTSYFQRPLDFGIDIVMYSLTKYMNGHSDVIMGAAICNDEAIAKRLRFLQTTLGAVPSPFDCYLVNRSLKTLALRMDRHKISSLIVAQWLENHPKVEEVMHPGLPSHKQHELSKKQTSGHSGTFSFRHSGGLAESKKFLCSLRVFTLALSFGGYESLAELPSVMTHAVVPETQKQELGITHALIRLSVGLEDVEVLIEDLEQAFNQSF